MKEPKWSINKDYIVVKDASRYLSHVQSKQRKIIDDISNCTKMAWRSAQILRLTRVLCNKVPLKQGGNLPISPYPPPQKKG